MNKLIYCFLFIIPLIAQSASAAPTAKIELNSLKEIEKRCPAKVTAGPILTEGDFKWNITFPEMLDVFKVVYESPKRLGYRAYYDAKTKTVKMPWGEFNGGDVEVPVSFIQGIQTHIEIALANKYADAVIFPDMGHSHLLIPQDSWEKKYDKYPVTQLSQMLTAVYKDPKVKVMYHTAEQLKTQNEDKSLVADPYLQWRHFTRNIIADNEKPYQLKVVYARNQSDANTLNSVDGYFWWGGGFNVSANKDGCFRYVNEGKTYGFDLSLYDLPEQAPQ